jgi:hypothetical protein
MPCFCCKQVIHILNSLRLDLKEPLLQINAE